jgi:hypothetical protein
MDDLIVIILTLIVLVAGAFGQMKKKKPAVPVPGQPQSPGDFWDFFDEKPDVQPFTVGTSGLEEQIHEKVNAREEKHDYEFVAQNEGGSLLSTEVTQIETAADIQNRPSRFALNKFSLRDAVIYNEILNTKYI